MFQGLVNSRWCLSALLALICFGFTPLLSAEHSEISLHLHGKDQEIVAGEPFQLLVELELSQGQHIYWKNPGESGRAPRFYWLLPEGVDLLSVDWPTPTHFEKDEMLMYGYKKSTVFVATLVSQRPHKELKASLKADWIVCTEDSCLPGEDEVFLKTLPHHQFEQKLKQVGDFASLGHVELNHDQSVAIVQTEKVFESAFFYPYEEGDTRGLKGLTLEKVVNDRVHFKVDQEIAKDPQGLLVLKDKQGNIVGSFDLTHAKKESFLSLLLSRKFLLALVLAFIGGLILNGMPCVLPVLSIKAMSLIKMAGDDKGKILRQTLSFTLGVILSFWVLASVLFMLTAWGRSVGWGFQLQEPLFVAFLAALLFIFSLNLLGVFEMGTSFASWAGTAEAKSKKEGLSGAFLSGVLATAVATPCTGPFLGSTLGLAMTLPLVLSYAIFTALALGLSFPYLLLGFYPKSLRYLPKPGAWMETFKQGMGFIMLATVLWLLWVFAAQTAMSALIIVLGAFWLISVAFWLVGRYCTPLASKGVRYLSYGFLISAISMSAYVIYDASLYEEEPYIESSRELAYVGKEGEHKRVWEAFSKERLEELKAEGRPVFIDFTAKWCLICQANHKVIMQPEVIKAMRSKNVVLMKADFTKRDAVIGEELKKHGRAGVPLYLLISGQSNQQPIILPQLLTQETLIEAVNTLD